MSFAAKYAMKKRMSRCAHGGSIGNCKMCMAEGGDVMEDRPANIDPEKAKQMAGSMRKAFGYAKGGGVHNADPFWDPDKIDYIEQAKGQSEAGGHSRMDSPRHKEHAKKIHREKLNELKSMKKPHLYAEGGEVDEMAEYDPMEHPQDKMNMMAEEEDDMIARIMRKRYSEGGKVANQTEPMADEEPTEFDDLVKDDDLDFHYDGANSGDELGDEAEDMNRRDIVERIMRSRAKKDKMPRPA